MSSCQKILQVFRDSLDSDVPDVKITAMELLIEMGKHREVDRRIRDTIDWVAQTGYSKEFLCAMGRAKYASPSVVTFARDRLLNGWRPERMAAIYLIGELRDQGSVPLLIQVAQGKNLSDEDKETLIQTIGKIGRRDTDVVGFLYTMSQSEHFGIRVAAVTALARLGLETEAISYLQSLMSADDIRQRMRAVYELVELGKQELAYPVLLEILKNYTPHFYWPEMRGVIRCVGYVQSHKDEIVPYLRKIAQDGRSWENRRTAFDALVAIGANDKETIELCRSALHCPDYRTRIDALRTLIYFGEATPEDVENADIREMCEEIEDLTQRLRTVPRERFSSEVIKAIADLLDRYYPRGFPESQGLLSHLGVVREEILDELITGLHRLPGLAGERILRVLLDMWVAFGCQSK